MTIYIKSEENGWEVERQIELPNDEKLVKSILRSVKRRATSPETAGGGIKPERKPQEAPPECTDMEVDDMKDDAEEPGYRGFLLVKCAGCGRVYAFNSRSKTTQAICKECGHKTPLSEMTQAEFLCPGCGSRWTYLTNLEDADAVCKCIRCGEKMRARWNKNIRKYAT